MLFVYCNSGGWEVATAPQAGICLPHTHIHTHKTPPHSLTPIRVPRIAPGVGVGFSKMAPCLWPFVALINT